MIEEKLNRVDELARNMDRIAHDVENLKIKILPPKHDINESIKAIYVSINESKERTARLRAKREFLEKAIPPGFYRSNDEDIKMIGVTPIESLFSNIKLDEKGTEEESTLDRRSPNCLEGDNLNDKNEKSGFGEVKTLNSNAPTTLDYKDFNYDSCSLIECISLLQSMINSPNAYEQNKAFTKHIVEAMMKAHEEKLELEVSIPRKLQDEWEPTIKVKIKDYECNALCDLGASVSTIPKSLCDVLGLTDMDPCSLNLHRINDVLILANINYVPMDFIVLDIECNPSCPIILGRPFLRTVGAIIDMKEGNIRFQFPLKKGMDHFLRKRIKAPYESIMRATYGINLKDDNT